MHLLLYFGPVRQLSTAVLAFLFTIASSGQTLLINELQAAGAPADRVEVFNASDGPVDLADHVFFLNGLHHRIAGSLRIAPHGFATLWFDRDPTRGPDHIGLKLPREGGTLLLIDPDGSTIVDTFTYPGSPDGVSMGREKDGGRRSAYFTTPRSALPTPDRSGLIDYSPLRRSR
jgi:hypothetical protein